MIRLKEQKKFVFQVHSRHASSKQRKKNEQKKNTFKKLNDFTNLTIGSDFSPRIEIKHTSFTFQKNFEAKHFFATNTCSNLIRFAFFEQSDTVWARLPYSVSKKLSNFNYESHNREWFLPKNWSNTRELDQTKIFPP